MFAVVVVAVVVLLLLLLVFGLCCPLVMFFLNLNSFPFFLNFACFNSKPIYIGSSFYSKQMFCKMTGFELQTSDLQSDCSANSATTTSLPYALGSSCWKVFIKITGRPWPLFGEFSFFSNNFIHEKTVDFSGIQTCIVKRRTLIDRISD